MRMLIVLVAVSIFSSEAAARTVYKPVSRPHDAKEVALDFSIVYFVLWMGYAATQYDAVSDISFESYRENMFETGAVLLDDTSPITNYLGHPYVGSEYYLYFRSRGYAPKWAFLNMFLTSAMFEIAVEGFSEPISIQDIIFTPLVGGPLGFAREKAGLRLVNSDRRFERFIGHILYLETNFKFFEKAEIVPAINLDGGFNGFVFNGRF